MSGSVREHRRKPLTGASRWGLVVGVVAFVLAADQLTKNWALNNLQLGPKDLFWTLRLNLAFNTGMAFSTGSGAGPIIGVIAIAITIAMVLFARKMNSRFQLVLIGMIIGGAFGNVLDRLFRSGGNGFMSGAVVDFIDLQWWPIFNVADAAVVVGGIALALASFREEEPAPESSPAGAEQTDGPTGAEQTAGPAGAEQTDGPTGAEQTAGPTDAEQSDGPAGAEQTDGPAGAATE